jgi:hypothetical protein
MVQVYKRGDLHAAAAPRGRHGEVDARGEHVGQPVKQQRGLMRHDASLAAPEPRDDEVFVVGGGKVAKSVDSTVDPQEPAGVQVVVEQAARVAGALRLGRREVAVLRGGEGEEGGPVGCGHAQM